MWEIIVKEKGKISSKNISALEGAQKKHRNCSKHSNFMKDQKDKKEKKEK